MHTSQQVGRRVPPSLADLVAQLEISRLDVVSRRDVAQALGVPESAPEVRRAIEKLRQLGWLRSLPAGGTYEFIPAASGPYSSGDPWIDLRAGLRASSGLRAQVGLSSAAFMRGLAARRPDPETVFVARDVRVPTLERAYRLIHVLPKRLFGAEDLNGVPVSTVERLIIEAALWWKHAGDLRASDHWLAEAVKAVDETRLRSMLAPMGPTTSARVGYLVARFGRPELGNSLAPSNWSGVVRIGPPDPEKATFHARWRLYDSIGVASR